MLSLLNKRKKKLFCDYWKGNIEKLTPPQPKARAKSFPVPNGRTPNAGCTSNCKWSNTDNTQPAVPSPPHARIRKWGTLRNISKLNFPSKIKVRKQSWLNSKRSQVIRMTEIEHEFYPKFGPPCVKSNTWRGFNSHWNFCNSFTPYPNSQMKREKKFIVTKTTGLQVTISQQMNADA